MHIRMSNILWRLSVFELENKRESVMAKKIAQFMVVLAILVASFASSGGASAWSGCASYITVYWGDTLSRSQYVRHHYGSHPGREPRAGLAGLRRTGVMHPDGIRLRACYTQHTAAPTLCNGEILSGKLPRGSELAGVTYWLLTRRSRIQA